MASDSADDADQPAHATEVEGQALDGRHDAPAPTNGITEPEDVFQREVLHRHGDRGQAVDVDADRAWLVQVMADRAGWTSRCQ